MGVRPAPRDRPELRLARPVDRRARSPSPRDRAGSSAGDALPARRRRGDHRGLPAPRIRRAAGPAGDRGPGLRRRAERGRPLAQRPEEGHRSARPSSAWNATSSGPRRSAGTSTPTARPATSRRAADIDKIVDWFTQRRPGAVIVPPANDAHVAHRMTRALAAVGLVGADLDRYPGPDRLDALGAAAPAQRLLHATTARPSGPRNGPSTATPRRSC